MPAMYGYASVVTSMPWSRASFTIASVLGVDSRLMLLRWTMCTGAPVTALAPITSRNDSTELPGSFVAEGPHVHEHRRVVLGRRAEDLEHFVSRRRRRVLQTHTDAECAGRESAVDDALHVGDLRVGGDLVAAGSRRQKVRRRILHHDHARAHVADRCAVVDERLPFPRFVELGNVLRSDLELERGGHAVEREDAIVLVILPVCVEVDEARRDDEAFGVDRRLAGDRRGRDRFDLAVADADESRRVETGLGVEHAAIGDDDVIRLLRPRNRRRERYCKDERSERRFHIYVYPRGGLWGNLRPRDDAARASERPRTEARHPS